MILAACAALIGAWLLVLTALWGSLAARVEELDAIVEELRSRELRRLGPDQGPLRDGYADIGTPPLIPPPFDAGKRPD